VRSKAFSALPPAKIRFIEPMCARLVNELPEGREWLYEIKFDGYRCLAGKDSTGVTLWSRRGNLFTNQFPHNLNLSFFYDQLRPFVFNFNVGVKHV
jgi:ATP-dependent DNA ligase